MTDEELEALVAASGQRMRLLVRFAYLTGIRQGDILAMRLTAATPDGIAYKDGKTGKNHLIAWSDELRTIWKKAAGMRIGMFRCSSPEMAQRTHPVALRHPGVA